MSAPLTIDQLKTKIRSLNNTLEKKKDKFLFYPMQAMEQRIKERVFVKGVSTGGKKRGYKWQEWIEIRKKRGRQVGYVDLFYQGDSFADEHSKPPSLWRTVKTVFENGTVSLIVDSDFNYNVKLGVEEARRKDTMLVPNGEEFALMKDLVEYSLEYLIDQALT